MWEQELNLEAVSRALVWVVLMQSEGNRARKFQLIQTSRRRQFKARPNLRSFARV